MPCVFCKRRSTEYVNFTGKLLNAMKTKLPTLTSQDPICKRCKEKSYAMVERLLARKRSRTQDSTSLDTFNTNSIIGSSSLESNAHRPMRPIDNVTIRRGNGGAPKRTKFEAPQSVEAHNDRNSRVQNAEESQQVITFFSVSTSSSRSVPFAIQEVIIEDEVESDDQIAISLDVPGSRNLHNTQPLIRTRRSPVFQNSHLVPIYHARTTGG